MPLVVRVATTSTARSTSESDNEEAGIQRKQGTTTRFGDDDDCIVDDLVELINAAYRKGEEGILVDTTSKPFLRVTRKDVEHLILSKQLLVLTKPSTATKIDKYDDDRMNGCFAAEVVLDGQIVADNEVLVGCIKVCRIDDDDESSDSSGDNVIGEWGCLAVHPEHQGNGYGRRLVEAAERYARTEYRCTHVQLELLAPSKWKHTHKERLRKWYTSTTSLRYDLAVPGDYEASTKRMAAGSLLGGRFELATDADFTLYRKKLV